MRNDKPKNREMELDDTNLVHRYFALRAEPQKDEPASAQDLTAEEQVENDWFSMGDQESWIEVRPGVSRSWEQPRKS